MFATDAAGSARLNLEHLNLEQQKKRAKELVRAHHAGATEAAERVVRQLPQARGLSVAAALARRLSLSEAQLVVAREAGFASWARLKHALEAARLGLDLRLEAALEAALAGRAPEPDDAAGAGAALAQGSLHLAAALGDAEVALALLEREPGLALIRAGLRQWSPLFYVCSARLGRGEASVGRGRARIAGRLIELGADPNEEIESLGSPGGLRSVLQAAARDAASTELVELLLGAGAELQQTGGAAGPVLPLTDAVLGGSIGCLQRLLAANPQPWQLREALEVAIEADRADMCRVLLDRGADADGAGRWWGQHGSCLHAALLLARGPQLFAVLLASSVDVERTDRDGRSPLRLAHRLGNHALAALLRQRGAREAELDAIDELVAACIAGSADAARRLLEARPELRASYRRTDHQVLCWAIRQRRHAALPLLLECGLDPNIPDDHGETPLHLAVASGHAPSIAALEAAGAPRAARNFEGRTPFEPTALDEERAERDALFEQAVRAVVDGDVEGLRELCDQEPDLVHQHSPRFHRATLLHYVAANGVEHTTTSPHAARIALLLLARGADVDALAHTYGGGPSQTTLGLAVTSVGPARAGVMGEVVRALVQGGAQVDGLQGDSGPLMGAIGEGQQSGMAALCEAGARIPNLYAAAAVGRVDLVAAWAPGAGPAELGAALRAASRFDRLEIVERLLASAAPLDATDEQHFTALHWAAWAANLAVIDLLLAHGAPLELRNVYGGTVLSTALFAVRHAGADRDHLAVIERLCAAGARVDALRAWTGLARVDAVLKRYGFAPNPPE